MRIPAGPGACWCTGCRDRRRTHEGNCHVLRIPNAETEYFYIQHKLTGFVLTPDKAHPDPGVAIRLFPVEPDRVGESQLWSPTGSGLVVNKASGLVLDVSGGRIEPGTRPVIVQWRAKDSSQDRRNQKWTV